MTTPDPLHALLLGILEGLTEFLPVSSTGHLILASELMGLPAERTVAFKVSIQFGAILAVVVAYWRRFWGVATGLVQGERGAWAFARNITLGFLPAMLVGALAYETIRTLLGSPRTVAVALVAGGGAILLIERWVHRVRATSVETMPAGIAAGVGLVQCLAMVPGVSRSGATIMGGLLMGLDRRTAAEFSFFLAVPTMLAAAVYALWQERGQLGAHDLGLIAIGFSSAFLSALLVVRSLVAIVARYGFAPFAWYRIAVGLAALWWLGP
ncbi:MAG: undecaprenyl-diphosphate phosphatase [Sphingomonadaceae bacterium]|uniref:undecaprenyl-diphosphate phosphatase n=1 Tax=Thermaurantiacus sp. TaxID=2820283 RepID=UPI00298EE411|nr:undecaprenyl-diphosphate phosphatase [Thermaurantiacus sp.]MCS6986226.1 undecaprenyl-diphosphate phosphatase [Sphingomonadaceae bacterium]MDW8415883.1 undecaprenyl-diphosphate phosphatase [Thermaurantiacus sp.]